MIIEFNKLNYENMNQTMFQGKKKNISMMMKESMSQKPMKLKESIQRINQKFNLIEKKNQNTQFKDKPNIERENNKIIFVYQKGMIIVEE
jgi:hypothetical protein